MAVSPRAPDSQLAGPSRSSSTAPTAVSPFPPNLSRSRTIPISATQPVEPFRASHQSTYDQPSSSLSSLPAARIRDPRPLPQSLFVDELNDPRSLSKASPHSVPANPWEVRDGEDILMEEQIQNYLFFNARSQRPFSMAQCDLRIFELHGRFSMPTRRIAVRGCGPGKQCVSHCKSFWNFNTPQAKCC